MYTMQTSIVILLATSFAQALPQTKIHQREIATTSPVLTFTNLTQGAWDQTSATDPEWVVGPPKNSTISVMDLTYLYKDTAVDDNGETLKDSRLWKLNIPKDKNCNITFALGFSHVFQGLEAEYDFTNSTYLLEVKEVICQNTTKPSLTIEFRDEKPASSEDGWILPGLEGSANSKDGWQLNGLESSDPPRSIYTTRTLTPFYWVPEPTPVA